MRTRALSQVCTAGLLPRPARIRRTDGARRGEIHEHGSRPMHTGAGGNTVPCGMLCGPAIWDTCHAGLQAIKSAEAAIAGAISEAKAAVPSGGSAARPVVASTVLVLLLAVCRPLAQAVN